jgi:hypothetical protein
MRSRVSSRPTVWTFRDGKVVGFDAYADRAGALKAVSVEE